MGTPRPRTVSAQTYQKFPQLVKAPVFDVEDSAYGMFRFENGSTLSLAVSWAANLTDEIPIGKWGFQELFSTTVYGPKDEKLPALTLFEDQAGNLVKVDVPFPPVKQEFVPQMENFLQAIFGEASAVNSAAQAVQLMEMLDAVYQSSVTGHEVALV